MSYDVLPTKEFERDFGRLDPKVRATVKKKILEMASDPTRYKHLHYDLSGSSRLRVGKLRIIFSYDVERREIYLEKIVIKHKYRD